VARRLLVGRAHAVGRPAAREVVADGGDAEVRAEELVRRAEQHVEPQRVPVEAPVRRVVDAVGPGERARGVREVGDAPGVGDRAEGVRRERERDHPHAVAGQVLLQHVEVERAVRRPQRHRVHRELVVGRHLQPRRHVGVVVELGHEDLVARLQRARHRVRQQEVERRHVRPERDLVRVRAGEVGGGGARVLDDGDRLLRGHERAAEVRVRPLQVAGHGVDHRPRHLRAAGAVEVQRRLAGNRPCQRREVAARGGDVEGCEHVGHRRGA
jgi:hypothetical protein